jgi:hypothetical protein
MKALSTTYRLVAALLTVLLVVPIPAASAESLGTIRGGTAGRVALDQGKTWVPLMKRSLPIFSGAQVRTAAGGAVIELKDGGRISVLPFSAVRFEPQQPVAGVVLEYGRMKFRLPATTAFSLQTSSGVVRPASAGAIEGELVAGTDGAMGLKMSEGTARLVALKDPAHTMLASLEPVFLPRAPRPGITFSSDTAPMIDRASKAVFGPAGENVGYLQRDGKLVVHPGFAADLSRPMPSRLVRLAMATIPDDQQTQDAVPLFDVQGLYVGYLAGPVFHAQSTTTEPCQGIKEASVQAQCLAAASESSAGSGGAGTGPSTTKMWALGAGVVGLGGVGAGAAALSGGSSSTKPQDPAQATPFAP